jgi:hypothetical protein
MKSSPSFEHETGLSKSGRANRIFSCLFSFDVNTDNVWVHFKAWNWAVLPTFRTCYFYLSGREGKLCSHIKGRRKVAPPSSG